MKIVGVDIGGTSIKIGTFDQHGKMDEFIEYETNSALGGKRIIENLIKQLENFQNFDAIGVCTAGQVDNERGMITGEAANIPGTAGLQVKKMLEDHFHVPVTVENDVNAAALGENYFGIGKELPNFLYLTYGTGIGGAIVIDSNIYYGENGFAGEFGHMITHGDGERCKCGLIGCYETYASTTALIKAAKKVNNSYDNGRVIFEKFHEGDEDVKNVVMNWIDEIVIGLISLTHIFNPQTIIVGGGVMEQEEIVNIISEKLREKTLEGFHEVEIVKATLGNKAGMLGAISLHL